MILLLRFNSCVLMIVSSYYSRSLTTCYYYAASFSLANGASFAKPELSAMSTNQISPLVRCEPCHNAEV